MPVAARLVLAALAVLSAGSAAAQPVAPPDPGPTVPAAALQADVALLRQAFGTAHPGLYRSHTPTEVDALLAALAADFSRDRTLREAYLRLSEFLAALRCGHTFVNPANQSDAVAAGVLAAGRRLPVTVRWLGRRLVVTGDRSGGRAGLAAGTEIVALDGVPAADVLARLLPLVSADGGNDAARTARLDVTGTGAFEPFDVLYPLVYPVGATTRLTVRGPLGAPERAVAVPTLTEAERAAAPAAATAAVSFGETLAAAPDSTGLRWTLAAGPDGTAVLTMPSWVTYRSAWDWEAFVDRAFAALAARGATGLVVDLRGNAGGTSVGDALLAHLVARDLAQAGLERWVRYRTLPADLRPALDTWDRAFDDWTDATPAAALDAPGDARDGLYRMTRYDDGPEGSVVRPRGPRFAGRVAVLVGPANSSATFEFAQAVQAAGLGVLVGQPTGGNRRGINGGAFYFLRLPGSGLEADLPLVGFFPPGGPSAVPDAGVTPDVCVDVTPDDLARGTDAEMAAAVAAVRRP